MLKVHTDILLWTVLHRAIVISTLFFTSVSQLPFDSSADIQLQLDATYSSLLTSLASSFLRWDSLHFLAMASPRPLPLPISASSSGQAPSQARGGGLRYEHSFAFQPGIVWLLRLFGYRSLNGSESEWSPSQAVVLTSVLAIMLGILQPVLLYSLTKRLTGDERHSRLSAFLSILSLSPGSLISPTPESFFSFFALLGHICLSSANRTNRITRTLMGSTCYALATAFRANGILLVGFVLWSLFWQKVSPSRLQSTLSAPLLVLICTIPFLFSQSFAYGRLCYEGEMKREWCKSTLPNIYTFVQKEYWNVSPFRYWSIDQFPNWLLAAPPLSLAGEFVRRSYTANFSSIIRLTLTPWKKTKETNFRLQSIVPHIHYTLITLLILLVNSHVQIALRFATPGSLPAVWWGASYLLRGYDASKAKINTLHWSASIMIPYLVLWNLTSIVLYAGFYPPA